jgi:hypothetical protein
LLYRNFKKTVRGSAGQAAQARKACRPANSTYIGMVIPAMFWNPEQALSASQSRLDWLLNPGWIDFSIQAGLTSQSRLY